MKSKGFTLIELLVVISIIGVLSSIVLVSFSGSRDKARLAKAQNFDAQISHALGAYAVGIWRFEEGSGTTAYDESGYGNNGELRNGASFVPDPYGILEGSVLQFDGGDDYVYTGEKINPSEVTVEAWVNINAHGYHNYIVSNARDCCDGYNGIVLQVYHNKKVRAGIWNFSPYFMYSNITLKINEWYHVVFAYKNPDMAIYINGKEDAKETSSLGIGQPSTYNMAIGGLGMNPAIFNLDGYLDDVRIYNHALSSAQIQQHYAAGAAVHGIAIKE